MRLISAQSLEEIFPSEIEIFWIKDLANVQATDYASGGGLIMLVPRLDFGILS